MSCTEINYIIGNISSGGKKDRNNYQLIILIYFSALLEKVQNVTNYDQNSTQRKSRLFTVSKKYKSSI